MTTPAIPEIFEFRDYKTYLNAWIESKPGRGRGERSALARALSSSSSYVTQVLSGSAHLSFEQADLLSRHLGHTAEEAQFFFLLVHHGRAGTPSLRQSIEAQIEQMLARRLDLKNRIVARSKLSEEDRATYYSAWYYSAIHILATLPGHRSRAAIAKYFSLSRGTVDTVVDFLVTRGLLEENAGALTHRQGQVHLEKDSPLIARHHTNWRLQAIRSLEREAFREELHYSVVIGMAQDDVPKVRKILVDAIEKVIEVVKDSKEDSLQGFTLDLFRV